MSYHFMRLVPYFYRCVIICIYIYIYIYIYILIRIYSKQGCTATTRHGVTRKTNIKRLKHTGNLSLEGTYSEQVSNFRLKAIQIIGQRKAFYRQRIPESGCVRKKTVEIYILVTFRNSDRKMMQSIRITSRSPLRNRKWNQLSQF